MKNKKKEIKKYNEIIRVINLWFKVFWTGTIVFWIINFLMMKFYCFFLLEPVSIMTGGITIASAIFLIQKEVAKVKLKKVMIELEKENTAKKTLNQNIKKEIVLKTKNNYLDKNEYKYQYKNRELSMSNFNTNPKVKRKK